MTFFEALFLGVIQGLTEFLPVSSSGHLVFFQYLIGIREPMLSFDIAVHWGTLLAVFVYYRCSLQKILSDTGRYTGALVTGKASFSSMASYPGARLGLLIILATVPTGFMGITFKDFFESLFHSVSAVGLAWFGIGVILLVSARYFTGEKVLSQITVKEVLILGIAQGIAIIPGISRSGMTIATALFLGIRKDSAAEFSFLMAIPAILGAGILQSREGLEFMQAQPLVLWTGFLSATLVGYAAISMLLKAIERDRFHIFGYYCLVMGAAAFLVPLFYTPA